MTEREQAIRLAHRVLDFDVQHPTMFYVHGDPDYQLPEPIDLEFDLANRVLYWTDRGDPPRGNTVNRAPIDKKAVPEILITHLMEGIGIALDVPGNRMFVTDFAGSLYSADLDGKKERNFLYAQGNLTGIAYAEVRRPNR